MKANKAPEKIYILQNGLCGNSDEDFEYIRTDVFIEKACEFLNKEIPITDLTSSNMLDIEFKVFDKESKKVFIEDFKKYMKE